MNVAENTCRTCGKMSEQEDGSDLYPMYSSTEYHNELRMVLEEFEIWNLNIAQGDGLPQKICLTCFDSFCQIHNFRMICQEAQSNFGELCIGLDIIIKLEAQYDDVDVDYPEDFEGEQTITVQEHYQFPADESQNVPDTTADLKTFEKLLEMHNTDDALEKGKQNELEKVVANVSDRNQYQCEYCMDVVCFDDTELLNQHYNAVHSSDLPYTCPQCEKCFKAKAKRDGHARVHFRETLECETCGRKIRGGKRMMDRHIEVHHILRVRECTICGKKFDKITLKRFNYHLSWHNENKLHKCKYCDKKFIQVKQLVMHERTHTGANPFLCTECGVGFTTTDLLEAHLKKHGVEDLQCPICPKSFAQQRNLKAHMQIHDPDKKDMRCDICPKLFGSTMNLRLHNHKKHGAPATAAILNILAKRQNSKLIKPFKCEMCSQSFVVQTQLEKHVKTHSEYRPYSCSQCGKSFKRDSHLKLHMDSVHLNNKPHKCTICGWGFLQKSSLREHITAKHEHTKDFKCDICERTFAIAKTLKIHKLKHLEKKPFKCTVCEKSFRLQNTLRTHMNSHWIKNEANKATGARK